MTTDIDTLWLFALVSKCQVFTRENAMCCLLLVALLWLTMTLLCWSHPGGPAWGKHFYFHHCFYTWRKLGPTSSTSTSPESSSRSRSPTSDSVAGAVLAKGIIPGPRGLPVFGSIQLMISLAHRLIAEAAEACKAKRLMAFSLGETRVIVTCHPDVAKEILNSSVFADRPVKESAYSLMFNRAIGFAPYGVYWRTLRRIAANHLFCPKQIKASEFQRSEIAAEMVEIFRTRGESLAVREVLKAASLNNMMCSIFGRRYELDSTHYEIQQLRELVDEGYDLLGTLNLSDHLPWLSDMDLQKVQFRCTELVPKVNQFVSRIIDEHRAKTTSDNLDFVDVLLSLRGPDKLSNSDMIAVLWEMIFRGTDTVAVLIEWILARIVLHPDVQSRVHDELDRVVGASRAVKDCDVVSMVYLTAVVKEVLRLHPPGPLLSWARLAITDTIIDGYHVPAGTTAMVNMWAISRDPDVWRDPMEFMPERFVSKEGEAEFSILGSDLRLAPFGSGRRTCPGKALGLATVTFWVATLLHEFEWLPCSEKNVDLSEVLKLSCEMATPLMVKLRPRTRIA